ncbi:MAG: hypothetical protein AUI36_09760 [Cyanobacteria bacterium 13_1_40CM_2_61_4]|nr:MAG: hypothetical protein AUI36_09760 [Cyanobacteria bacterium 13_1_40CM_2_61_4]
MGKDAAPKGGQSGFWQESRERRDLSGPNFRQANTSDVDVADPVWTLRYANNMIRIGRLLSRRARMGPIARSGTTFRSVVFVWRKSAATSWPRVRRRTSLLGAIAPCHAIAASRNGFARSFQSKSLYIRPT